LRTPGAEGISVAVRATAMAPFGQPQPIAELQFPGTDPAPRFISADGLTLYLDRQREDVNPLNWFTWVTTRKDRQSPWQAPVLMETKLPSPYEKLQFVQASALDDGRRLLCLARVPDVNGQEQSLLGLLSRSKPSGPFTNFQPITLK